MHRLLALLILFLPSQATAQSADLIEDTAFCDATIAEWEEREPMVLGPDYFGNHYMACSWDPRSLPWPLPTNSRLSIPRASCADNQEMPRSRFWITDISGRVWRDGRVTLNVPGFARRRITFHRCPAG